MRLTPSQIGMTLLLGARLPGAPEQLKDRIRQGHQLLTSHTRQDFGFNPLLWHEYLRQNAMGYRWSNRHLGVPKRILEVTQSPEWCEVENLRSDPLEPISPVT